MKRFWSVNFIVFGLLGFLFASCDIENKEETCTYTEIGGVLSVVGSNNAGINEKINLEVKFGVGNGCGQFNKFIETDFVGNEKIIEVEAIYIGCVCTQDAPIRTVNYEFIASTSGIYKLKFKKNSGGYIIHEILIN